MREPKKSIYQLAGERGIPFGLYLACVGVSSVFADWFAPLSVLFMVLLVATPAVVYYFQRRKFTSDDGFTEYAALWMLGILMFLLGGILASFVVYVVLTCFRPDFIYEQARGAVEIYRQMPQMRGSELATVLERAVEQRALPTPIELVYNIYWFVAFGGSVTSALTALAARRALPSHRRQEPDGDNQ